MAKIAYFRQRLKNRIHQLVLREFRRFERQGLSRSELARRIHRRPEQITRWLGNPSNWTLDTLSDLMLGMGGEPDMYFVAPGERALPDQSRDTAAIERAAQQLAPSKPTAPHALEEILTGRSSNRSPSRPLSALFRADVNLFAKEERRAA